EGRYRQAAQAFEALAKEHPSHSYGDDAWVLAGESWEQQPEPDKAAEAYRKAVAAGGDKESEARRRLLLQLFSAGDAAGALALCEAALQRAGKHHGDAAKFQ